VIRTTGDIDRSSPFTEMKDSSLFTKEIEHALLLKEVDIAVHSLKDLSSSFPEGLDIAAYTGPKSRGDAFVSLKYKSLNDVPGGGSIGTASPRRQACLMRFCNDVQVKPIRGNVPTRLKKMERGEYDAILLAAAGLERLGLGDTIREYLPVNLFVPSSGQGILAVQCREGDRSQYSFLDISGLRETAEIEFSCMRCLNVGCSKPVGIHAEKSDRSGTSKIYILHIFISDSEFSFFYNRDFVLNHKGEIPGIADQIKEEIESITGRTFSL
jgi:hydroxymethylbilane synthase